MGAIACEGAGLAYSVPTRKRRAETPACCNGLYSNGLGKRPGALGATLAEISVGGCRYSATETGVPMSSSSAQAANPAARTRGRARNRFPDKQLDAVCSATFLPVAAQDLTDTGA